MANSRSPHGERGLKFVLRANLKTLRCRSPHGERGLKLESLARNGSRYTEVAPPTGSVD